MKDNLEWLFTKTKAFVLPRTNIINIDVSYILATLLLYFVGYFRSEFYPFSFPVGKSNVSIKCVSNMYEINKEITHDIRNNKNENFISVLKCNESGLHWLNNNTKFEGVHILSFRDNCLFNHNWFNYIELTVSLQTDKCILGPQTSASWRCLFSNETYTFNSSEKDIYSIKGNFIIITNCHLLDLNRKT